MQHSDRIILQKILNAVNVAEKIFGNITLEQFLNDEHMKLSMAMSVIRIGELVKNLTSELRRKNPQVVWRDIAGFRDVAAHKYETLDMEELYITVKDNFPELKRQITEILNSDLKEGEK